MCTRPITIKNNTQFQYIGCKVQFDVPCCHCKECIDAKVRGYLLRNFLQYKLIASTCGYAYFDTLTYNNECLPKTDGQGHFDSRHVRNFMKRLRIAIFRKYGIRRDAFKFFLVCEFSPEKIRPHYHVLFYVMADIPLMEFKRLVNKSWWYGFTDSYYATKKHVLTSCAAIRYLVKYLTKYADFEQWRDDYIRDHVDSPIAKWDKQKLRMYRPFLRLSNNLGYTDDIDLLSCDVVQIPNKKGYDLFCYTDYYKRKQLYEKIYLGTDLEGHKIYQKTAGGSYMYQLSAKGIEYKKQHYGEMITSVQHKYEDLYQMMPFTYRESVEFLLHGRSLHDLAVFSCVFKYKMFDLPYLHRVYNLKKDWDSFCFDLYCDSLQITGRNFPMDYFIQIYHDREFPETCNMYEICNIFKFVERNKTQLKHDFDEEKLSKIRRLENKKMEIPSEYHNFFNQSLSL